MGLYCFRELQTDTSVHWSCFEDDFVYALPFVDAFHWCPSFSPNNSNGKSPIQPTANEL
jgi:hypothetical protein